MHTYGDGVRDSKKRRAFPFRFSSVICSLVFQTILKSNLHLFYCLYSSAFFHFSSIVVGGYNSVVEWTAPTGNNNSSTQKNGSLIFHLLFRQSQCSPDGWKNDKSFKNVFINNKLFIYSSLFRFILLPSFHQLACDPVACVGRALTCVKYFFFLLLLLLSFYWTGDSRVFFYFISYLRTFFRSIFSQNNRRIVVWIRMVERPVICQLGWNTDDLGYVCVFFLLLEIDKSTVLNDSNNLTDVKFVGNWLNGCIWVRHCFRTSDLANEMFTTKIDSHIYDVYETIEMNHRWSSWITWT